MFNIFTTYCYSTGVEFNFTKLKFDGNEKKQRIPANMLRNFNVCNTFGILIIVIQYYHFILKFLIEIFLLMFYWRHLLKFNFLFYCYIPTIIHLKHNENFNKGWTVSILFWPIHYKLPLRKIYCVDVQLKAKLGLPDNIFNALQVFN